jgi:hypothetical protein
MSKTWEVRCAECAFRGVAGDESTAESVAALHRDPSGHRVRVLAPAGAQTA